MQERSIAAVVARFGERGDATAVTEVRPGEDDRVLGYAALGQAVRAAAALLATVHHIGRGDRVATICRNSAELIIADLAVMALGAVVVPLDPGDTAAELGWAVSRVRASLVVHDTSSATAATDAAGGVPTVAASQLTGPSHWSPPADVPPDAPAVILFSSGSTARPKGIVLSHGNLLANAASLRAVHRIEPADRHLCVLPLFHANAFGFSMVTVLSAGAHLVLMAGFQPLEFSAAVSRYHPHVASLVPELLRSLATRKGLVTAGGSLRYVVSAAAPLSGRVARDFTAVTGLRVHQGYGLSECTNFATAVPADLAEETYADVIAGSDPPSIGPAVPGCELGIRTDDGGFAADGIEGEIVVRGPSVMRGYWEDEEATRAALADGWLRTGDQGFARTVHGARFFFVNGRRKELIIRLGEKISPSAVARELAEYGANPPFAVIGFTHVVVGEEVGAYAERPDGHAVDEVITAIRELPFERRPKVLLVGDAEIPRTSTGKIRRHVMKSWFGEYSHTRFMPASGPMVAIRRPENLLVGRGD